MKKKLLFILMAIAMAFACAFALAACDEAPVETNGGNQSNSENKDDENDGKDKEEEKDDGDKDEHSHSYSQRVVEPTCTAQGYVLLECECGDSIKEGVTEPLGHSFINYVPQGDATCTQDGTKAATCERCTETKIVTDVGSAGHRFVDGYCEMCGDPDTTVVPPVEEPEEPEFVYTYSEIIENGEVVAYSITGVEYAPRPEAIIPAEYNGKPVTAIGDDAFSYCRNLLGVTIPEGVTSIGDRAFQGYAHLIISIPDSLTYIGEDVFGQCDLSYNFVDDETLCYLGNENNPYVMLYDIKDGKRRLDEYVINPNTKIIYDYALSSTVKRINIPASIVFICPRAFSNCGLQTSITVASGNPVYHSDANCLIETATKTLILGSIDCVIPSDGSVTKIGAYAFDSCTGMKAITIPDNVTEISSLAFRNCNGLTEIIIPDSVTEIGEGAFEYCPIETASFPARAAASIPKDHLTTVNITSGEIGERAFYNLKDLTGLTIGSGVTGIGGSAFSGCTGLTDLTIPASVTNVSYSAFNNCSGLESLTVAAGNSVYQSAGNCIIETATNTLVLGCKNSVIPTDGSVTNIGNFAFGGCTGLTEINIPEAVTSIGRYAFSGCSELADINIHNDGILINQGAFADTAFYENENNWENGVLYLGKHLISAKTSISGTYEIKAGTLTIACGAFTNCTQLTGIVIAEGITSISSSAFSRCSGLMSITIPATVTEIGQSAFSFGNNSLKDVYFGGTEEQWNAISKTNSSLSNYQVHYLGEE